MAHPTHIDSLHVVTISRLSPSADYRVFAAICRSARVHNPTVGVGGVLLFDGERFCQWLHGNPAAVEDLMATIALDQRHVNLQLLHHATVAHIEVIDHWRCGFVLPDALDVLDRAGVDHENTMGLFKKLLATADLEPPMPSPVAPELPAHASCAGH